MVAFITSALAKINIFTNFLAKHELQGEEQVQSSHE